MIVVEVEFKQPLYNLISRKQTIKKQAYQASTFDSIFWQKKKKRLHGFDWSDKKKTNNNNNKNNTDLNL